MNTTNDGRRIAEALFIMVIATLLFFGPCLGPGERTDGVSVAGPRDGGGKGKAARGGGKSAPRASKVDRQPRAASAQSGTIRQASKPASRPTRSSQTRQPTSGKAKQPQRTATAQDRSAFNNKLQGQQSPKAGGEKRDDRREAKADKREDRKEASADRREDAADKREDRREDTAERREERREDVQDARKDYRDNREEIRDERREASQELREGRRDFAEERREDRMDFAEDWRDDRYDLYEDIYDDRRYWGYDYDDDDDDHAWLWGIVGGVAGYAIGAAVNSPPEGTVSVPYNNTTYQYYGGAFYQPAPSGQGYVTAPAPVGATVEAPPIDCTIVFGPSPDDPGYCYFQGAFVLYDEKSDSYAVTEPAVGTEVPYVPEGYEVQTANGVDYYKLGGTYYRPYVAGDEEVFVVSRL